jgi:hypothetical protein
MPGYAAFAPIFTPPPAVACFRVISRFRRLPAFSHAVVTVAAAPRCFQLLPLPPLPPPAPASRISDYRLLTAEWLAS